jgi:TatD DNase family protein
MIELIDIGVNLTNKSLLQDLEGVLERATQVGVKQMVVTGTTIEESDKAITLCQQYPQRLVSTCGIHPHHAGDWNDDSFDLLESMAQHDCVRAIGETGLDYNRNYSSAKDQEHAFTRQLDLAVKLQMPVFCHQRDAHDRFLAILSELREQLPQVVVHCFTDNQHALMDYLDLDCHIGVTGWICDERRGLELQQLVKLIPDNRLLLETDAPYLLPRNLIPKPSSRINEPAYLPHILQSVALHRNQTSESVAQQTLYNSREFFSL